MTIHESGSAENIHYILLMKGAPEKILDRCSTILEQGDEKPLGEESREEINKAVAEMAQQGDRVLGCISFELETHYTVEFSILKVVVKILPVLLYRLYLCRLL